MNEFDQTHSSLLYNQHELQGLNLLAQALDQRIQNSISLVWLRLNVRQKLKLTKSE